MSTSCADLRDVIQQRFVKSLNGVGMHLHAVGDELDEVGNRVISDVAASLQGGGDGGNVKVKCGAQRAARLGDGYGTYGCQDSHDSVYVPSFRRSISVTSRLHHLMHI